MAIEQDAMTIEERIFEKISTNDVDENQPSEEESNQAEETTQEVEEQEEVTSEDKEVEVDKDAEEESDEPWMPNNLDELAAAMEVETDDLKSIRVKTKVDGVEGEATLADVIKNYQFDKSLTERSEAFATERKKFEEASANVQQEYQQKISDAEAMVQVIEDQLNNQISGIDWEQLRVDNPAEWSARRQEFVEQIGQVEQAKQKILQSRQEEVEKQQKEFMRQHEAALAENSQRLMEAIPELRDPKVREEKLGSIKSYLRSQGVGDQELNTITDYRVIVLAEKAMQYDAMQTKAQPAKAKAKKQPKFTKPGAAKTAANDKADEAQKRHSRLKQTGNVNDLAALLESRI